jgi:gamma-glutamyltranspeptidase/glutathione hydrolase
VIRLRSVLLFSALLAMPVALTAQQEIGATGQVAAHTLSMAGRSTVYAPNGAIATSQPLATAAGLDVLMHGGNAIDAAVTAAAVEAVVEAQMTGPGGDCFALLWSAKEHRLVGMNASGRSGSLMTREALLARGFETMPAGRAEDVTVPGAVAGWAALLERYGTISLAQALAPAIRLAQNGFPMSPIIARQWDQNLRKLQRNPNASATYLVDGERTPAAGEWFRNPDLAGSLRTIAEQGPAAMYGGELGQRIVTYVKEQGGFLTLADMRAMKVEWVEPISVEFRGYRVWELPPNNQGVAALEMLKILEPYQLKALGHNTAPYLHRLIEAKKLAFADLYHYIGDPADMTISPEALLSPAYIARRRAQIDTLHAIPEVEPGDVKLPSSETIYLTAADSEGNMVSFINSNYDLFGSGLVAPGTGFVLQDRGAGFTLTPGLANTVGPRKRPLHTLIPGFVTKPDSSGTQQPYLSFGVMGGSMQPQGHVQLLLNLLVFGMTPQAAADAARFRHLSGLDVALEPPIGDAVRRDLTAMGHHIVDESRVTFGGAQLIIKLPRGYAAASDPRKDGMAAGY